MPPFYWSSRHAAKEKPDAPMRETSGLITIGAC
jgi:hypothetical protein